ncbi:UbiA prenyltransferase [Apiospora sp. TS-2023a]
MCDLFDEQLAFSKQYVSPNNSKFFVGGTRGRWVELLPTSWVPYIQLMRLNIAAPLAFAYFPHLFGLLHAAMTDPLAHTPLQLLWTGAMLLGWSFFCSNAAHAWDDLVDAQLDAQMARTRHRPIVRGAISPRAALLFVLTQAVAALLFLLRLLPHPAMAAAAALPSVVLAAYYPFAKRHSNFPQMVLGLCLGAGVVVGRAAASATPRPWLESPSALYLAAAFALIMATYDTIYAYQDRVDDIGLGVGSLAVLCGNYTKPCMVGLLPAIAACLYGCGVMAGNSPMRSAAASCGPIAAMGLMLFKVDLGSPTSCWYWFSVGFWTVNVAITANLLVGYLVQLASL